MQAEREISDWAKRLKSMDIATEVTALRDEVAKLSASVSELVGRQAAEAGKQVRGAIDDARDSIGNSASDAQAYRALSNPLRVVLVGSIGGSAARLAQHCIKKVEVHEYPELGMEASWKIEVENFPAFIVIEFGVREYARGAALCKEIPVNRTKMFHVKHFCPVEAENLTNPHTSASWIEVGLRGKFVFDSPRKAPLKLSIVSDSDRANRLMPLRPPGPQFPFIARLTRAYLNFEIKDGAKRRRLRRS